MSTELREALEQVAGRFRRFRLWSGLGLCWLAWAIVGLALLALNRAGDARTILWLAIPAVGTAVAWRVAVLRSARDLRWVARRIEARHPDLATALLAAVEQPGSGRIGFLQAAVVGKVVEHGRTHDWSAAVPVRAMRISQIGHGAALGLLLAVIGGMAARAFWGPVNRTALLAAGIGAEVQVEPGSTDVERGSPLLIIARFPAAVPAEATLAVEAPARGSERRGMSRSLDDPTFATRLESVDADLSYKVEFEGHGSPTYRVTVFEYPELQRADARLVYPSYTAIEPKRLEDIRHVTAVEGTELTLDCRLNKDVADARLIDEKGGSIELKPQGSDGRSYRTVLTLADTHRYKVELTDRQGRKNKQKAELLVNVGRNRPPTITVAQPSRDVRVSPIEELTLKAKLEDDYGLIRHGLSYQIAEAEPKEVVLPPPGQKPIKSLAAEHRLDFESLHATPDQLATYFFWAEDVGPDGKPRRTSGDMFFAEVRHFEEIFRQGEQPAGGSMPMEGDESGGGAQQAEKLVEIQKEIINGTWKLIRREAGPMPSEKFAEDAKVLLESQQAALEQAGQLAERLRDTKSKAELDQATRRMKEAEKQLAGATAGPAVAPLNLAMPPEQAAYQALLKLRAREFQVVRNNSRSRSQGGASGGPSQNQLQQLELSNEENRYEEQRSARSDQQRGSKREQEQREARQVLNRLRELARRQADLNDRLKEMQAALEAAKTPEARKEIERQLKRLREQEEQILRDTDEVRQRMEQEQNRERMAQARQQMEQGRENVRQASKALEEGRLSQALTAGSRAGRQLDEVREQVRKDTANQFAEDMTEMRRQARQLDEDQARLSQQMEAQDGRNLRSLRDDGRKPLQQGLEKQQAALDQLLERMRQTVQDAEQTEPLLAKGLFDTARKADERKVGENLKLTRQMLDAGLPEAAESSRRAGQGIGEIKQGVERAAERILGDETSALKRAQGEVDDLRKQVDREIARATGRDPNRPEAGPSKPVDPFDAVEMIGPDGKPQPEAGRGEPGKAQAGDDRQARQGAGRPSPKQARPRTGLRGGDQPKEAGQPGQGDQAERQAGQQGEGGQGTQAGQPGQGGRGQQGDRQAGQPGQGGRDSRPDSQAERGQGGGGGSGGNRRRRDNDSLLEGAAAGGPGGPITGEGFRPWTDRMRDVEELLDDPELRGRAAQIRDRVRGAREEFKRHAREPDWNQLKSLVAEPLRELGQRLAEEVRRRESPDSLVPIDRDPVPPRFAEGVRRYYERLGSGR